jgi:hypothetical protein
MAALRSYRLALGLLLAGCGSHATAQGAPVTINLFAPKPPPSSRAAPQREADLFGMKPETVGAVGYFALLPDAAKSFSARGAAAQKFRIVLPNRAPVVCSLSRQVNADGTVVLSGAPVGTAAGHCALAVKDGQISGFIDTASGRYRIVPAGPDNTHAIVEIRTEGFADERPARRKD